MALFDRRTVLKAAGTSALMGALVRDLAATDSPSGPARRRIRIGQIGVGHAHASKLAVYGASADYDVVGIVEPDSVLRARAQSQPVFGGLAWMTREQLLDVPGLEAVLIETRVRDLLNEAEVCLATGKHIHLDKPAGQSLPQLRRLLGTASAKGLLVQMGYTYR
jgi:predicted dehydrogenase